MKRLIDANELITALYHYEHEEGEIDAYTAQDIINSAPTIDAVEVVRGEWIDEHEGGHGEWVGTCNQCGKTARVGNFCPNCGARMKGADDGNK